MLRSTRFNLVYLHGQLAKDKKLSSVCVGFSLTSVHNPHTLDLQEMGLYDALSFPKGWTIAPFINTSLLFHPVG